MTKQRVLIAGIGNIFLGDDAFGVEVVGELMKRGLPKDVEVVDFGIRSFDLAYALAKGYEAVILVDALQRGNEPGTVYLFEPDSEGLKNLNEVVNGHSMNPLLALQLAETLEGEVKNLYLIGCEPARLESEDGQIGLSDDVRSALPKAIGMIESLVNKFLKHSTTMNKKLLNQQ